MQGQPMQEEREFGESLKFFADWQSVEHRRNGLNVQYVTTRRGEQTLALELAPIVRAGSAPDWGRKVALHLTRDELTGLCATLLGRQEQADGAYHGEQRNKSFIVRAKEGHGAWIGLSNAGKRVEIILTPEQRMALCAFSLRRLSHVWQVPVQAVIEIIRSC